MNFEKYNISFMCLKSFDYPFSGELRILGTAKACKPEITFSVSAKSTAGCTDYIAAFEQIIKEIPALHAAGALKPNIRRVFSSEKADILR